jgi:hypothetical protein
MITRQNWLNLLRKTNFLNIFLINDRHFDYKQKFPQKTKNQSKHWSQPQLDKGPHSNNPFTAALAFLAALSLKLPQFPRRIPASLSRRHIDCGLMFQRVFFFFLFCFWNPGIFGRDPPAPKRLSAAAGCGTNQLAKLQNYLPRYGNARVSYMHLSNQQPAYCCDPAADSAPNLDLSRYSCLHLQVDQSFTNYYIILLTL